MTNEQYVYNFLVRNNTWFTFRQLFPHFDLTQSTLRRTLNNLVKNEKIQKQITNRCVTYKVLKLVAKPKKEVKNKKDLDKKSLDRAMIYCFFLDNKTKWYTVDELYKSIRFGCYDLEKLLDSLVKDKRILRSGDHYTYCFNKSIDNQEILDSATKLLNIIRTEFKKDVEEWIDSRFEPHMEKIMQDFVKQEFKTEILPVLLDKINSNHSLFMGNISSIIKEKLAEMFDIKHG